MSRSPVRVRFAPSPTGMMHLGNVRTALMNFLFARAHEGTFILRVEDTDPQRNFDPGAQIIMSDLAWLNLKHDEGPQIGGPYEPYFQSERQPLYEAARAQLEKDEKIYRCFCSSEELEKKRERQRLLKMPPRYDRTCDKLSAQEIQENVASGVPFIWRMRVPQNQKITITDLAAGNITFDLKDFSDLPISRQDGTFTFMFANFYDDMTMKISHVLRGQDHLSNTAGQAILYQAFDAPFPVFWHMPILCNIEGKKLSKRDFGFSLKDLRDAGYLPEAIDNYLGIIGGSFEQEIMSLDQLVPALDFEHIKSSGQIKYDPEKLTWVNHKWIAQYDISKLTDLCVPFIEQKLPAAAQLPREVLEKLIGAVQTDLKTLADAPEHIAFFVEQPDVTAADFHACVSAETLPDVVTLIGEQLEHITSIDTFVSNLKSMAKDRGISLKHLFWTMRIALTGKPQGLQLHDLIELLGADEAKMRLKKNLRDLT